jgi:hypothetical protein
MSAICLHTETRNRALADIVAAGDSALRLTSDPLQGGHMTAPDHFAEAQLNILRRRARTSWSMHSRLAAWSQLPEDAEPLRHHR